MSKMDWIVVHDGTDGKGMRLHCLRCGEVYVVNMPVEVGMFVAMSRAFGKTHGRCRGTAAAGK